MPKNIDRRKWLIFTLVIIVFGVAVCIAVPLPDADWYGTYYPTIRNVLAGKSPYDVAGFHNPPWMLLLMLPFGLFPLEEGRALFFIASVLVFVFILWKTESGLLATIAIFLSPTLLGGLLASNPDIFVLSGVLISPVWGLFVLLIKPQLGLGLVFYYAYVFWKKGSLKDILRVFAPITLGYLLSFLIFPVLVDKLLHKASIDPWNRSLFLRHPIGAHFLVACYP